MIIARTVRFKDGFGQIVTMRCDDDINVGRDGWTIVGIEPQYERISELGMSEKHKNNLLHTASIAPEWVYTPTWVMGRVDAFVDIMERRGITVEILEELDEMKPYPSGSENRIY